MPVAICVFWWDAPLSLWNYGSVLAGGRVLASDVLLCVAFFGCYRTSCVRAAPEVANLAAAETHRAHDFRRLDAAQRSQLLSSSHRGRCRRASCTARRRTDGRIRSLGIVDLARRWPSWSRGVSPDWRLRNLRRLCVVMPTFDLRPLLGAARATKAASCDTLLALVAFALNGLLMLAYLDYYQGALQRSALTLGESGHATTCGHPVFVHPGGPQSARTFASAQLDSPGDRSGGMRRRVSNVQVPSGVWCQCCCSPRPSFLARRLHDMGWQRMAGSSSVPF